MDCNGNEVKRCCKVELEMNGKKASRENSGQMPILSQTHSFHLSNCQAHSPGFELSVDSNSVVSPYKYCLVVARCSLIAGGEGGKCTCKSLLYKNLGNISTCMLCPLLFESGCIHVPKGRCCGDGSGCTDPRGASAPNKGHPGPAPGAAQDIVFCRTF